MKSQAFVTGLKHAMYRDNKKDLFDYIQRGDIDGIDSYHIKEVIEYLELYKRIWIEEEKIDKLKEVLEFLES